MMDRVRIEGLLRTYRDGLLEDTLPFWVPACVDREFGGFHFALDRQGNLFETDKGVWQQGRFTWLLGTLYSEVEPREQWLELCTHGVRFLEDRCFDPADGRAWFHLTREGEPLRKRRYAFGEAFAAMGFAAHARASGSERSRDLALRTWEAAVRLMTEPGALPPKFTGQRPMRSIGAPMIRLGVAQVLREMDPDPRFTEEIDRCIGEIEGFVRPELGAVLENMGVDGSFHDHEDGRILNPGHALEAGWFILEEARHRGGDQRLVELGVRIVDLSWPWAWDEDHGGILYFRDVLGKPVGEYWHDMKFWWPHNEAILATLLAWEATGEPRHAERHGLVHDWAYTHLADPECGEWFGYLHRDGTPSSTAKGNLWKGPFHLPRMQLLCWRACERLLDRPT